jgi:hypothetical protein
MCRLLTAEGAAAFTTPLENMLPSVGRQGARVGA